MQARTLRVRGDTRRVWRDVDDDHLGGTRRERRPFDELEQAFFQDQAFFAADVAEESDERPFATQADAAVVDGDEDEGGDVPALSTHARARRRRIAAFVGAGLVVGIGAGFAIPRIVSRLPTMDASVAPAAATVNSAPARASAAQRQLPVAAALPEVTVPEVPDPTPGAPGPRAVAGRPAAAATPDEEEAAAPQAAKARPLEDVVWSDRLGALVPAASLPATAPGTPTVEAPATPPAAEAPATAAPGTP